MARGPELARPAGGLPKAATEQLDLQPWEHDLLALARVHHPAVAWWHGYRRAEERFGSYCYVCESFIITWGGNAGPPKAAVAAIHDHKMSHHNGTDVVVKPTTRKRRTA